MKKNYLFYGIAILAIAAFIVGFISYATETRTPQKVGTQQASAETTTQAVENTSAEISPAAKKKECGCCAERLIRLREQIRKARERKAAAQQAETTVVAQ